VLIFTGSGLMGREVINIRSSDVVVIVGRRSGTLGELAIAYDEGKLIGVLTGMGGVGDMAAQILAVCAKDTGARVVYEADPDRRARREWNQQSRPAVSGNVHSTQLSPTDGSRSV